MDQDSFRTLLSSAAPLRTGTGRAAGVLGTTALKRGYGVHSGAKVKDLTKKEEKVFVPRKTSKKNDKYQDRAEMRRLGKEDEFNEMEQMLADFERNARESGETEAEIERKRAYLGGDATHSILVKGLDFSLLAARKAELAQEEGGKAEEELDGMLDQGIGSSSLVDPIGGEAGVGGKKRGLEELLEGETRKKKKKVKPEDLGTTGAGGPVKSSLPSKFKSINAPTAPVTEPKLKRKKKKKIVKHEEVPGPVVGGRLDTVPSESSKVKSEGEEPVAGPSRPSDIGSPTRLSAAVVKVEDDHADEDEDDIFGGVGMYDNPLESSGEDSDTEEGRSTSRPVAAAASRERLPPLGNTDAPRAEVRGKQGKGWFGDEQEEDPLIPTSFNPLENALQSVTNRKARRAQKASGRGDGEPVSGSDQDEDDGDVHRPLARLQGLSSSVLPSAKELLEMDAAASAADKRRAKKAKWRAKQGLAAQDQADDDDDEDGGRGKEGTMDESQKLNRDVQQLSAYMEKKEKAKV